MKHVDGIMDVADVDFDYNIRLDQSIKGNYSINDFILFGSVTYPFNSNYILEVLALESTCKETHRQGDGVIF